MSLSRSHLTLLEGDILSFLFGLKLLNLLQYPLEDFIRREVIEFPEGRVDTFRIAEAHILLHVGAVCSLGLTVEDYLLHFRGVYRLLCCLVVVMSLKLDAVIQDTLASIDSLSDISG